jgi:hypothetical protein
MTDNMIERVARAMCMVDESHWEHVNQALYRKVARVAIEALREPTQKMRLAGVAAYEHTNPTLIFNVIWRAMIDAALGDAK